MRCNALTFLFLVILLVGAFQHGSELTGGRPSSFQERGTASQSLNPTGQEFQPDWRGGIEWI